MFLTNNNTIPFVAAKLNNGADLESGSSQNFDITNAAQTGLGFTGDFTVSFWWKPESTTEMCFLCKSHASGANRSYTIGSNGGTTLYLAIMDGAGNFGSGGPANFTSQTLTNGTWYHMVWTYTVSTGLAEFWKDGVSQGTRDT